MSVALLALSASIEFVSSSARVTSGPHRHLDPIKIHYIYLFLTAKKDVQVARNGGRGGEVIRAMPERKHSFLNEVFPYPNTVYLESRG